MKALSYLLALMILVSLIGALVVRRSSERTGQPPGPCDHLTHGRHTIAGTAERMDWAVAQYVTRSHVIAKAVITDVGTPRFSTASGSPPPPLPTTATEEDMFHYEDQVFSVVVLDATDVISGGTASGYVVTRAGGVVPTCPDYVYTSVPVEMRGGVGDVGMIFLDEPPAFLQPPYPPWYAASIAKADELNLVPGANYQPMLVDSWFRYESGVTGSTWMSGTIPVAQFEVEVQAAVP